MKAADISLNYRRQHEIDNQWYVDVSKCWKRLRFSVTCLDFLNLYEVKDNSINDQNILPHLKYFWED